MRIGVTGATGLVGHPIAAHFLAAGDEVITLGRRPSQHPRAGFRPYDLDGPAPDLSGIDVLVHAAFAHVPGRYRGGEGDDPEGFLRRNRDGSIRLFEAARAQGLGRILFLSSRAVYGAYPPGTPLPEPLEPRPDTLYGRMKLSVEQALAGLAGNFLATASLRATGVYGPPVPGRRHKWHGLFADFARGAALPPRAGTELHAQDLAAAVRLLATTGAEGVAGGPFNASDFVLDRRDLLAGYAALSGQRGLLPVPADRAAVCVMGCDRLAALGWRPRGPAGLTEVLAAIVAAEG